LKILLVQPKMNKRPMDTGLKTRMAPSLALLTLININRKYGKLTAAAARIIPMRVLGRLGAWFSYRV